MKKIKEHKTITTERYPNEVPEGVTPLPEPWLAYIGVGPLPEEKRAFSRLWRLSQSSFEWIPNNYGDSYSHYAVDVRSDYAKKHWPELVAAMEYREPSPIAQGHNPHGLTEEQVGVAEGWRLLTEEEMRLGTPIKERHCVNKRKVQYLSSPREWRNPIPDRSPLLDQQTYRTKEAPGYFLPKPRPLITEEERKAIKVLFPWAKFIAWNECGTCFVHAQEPKIANSNFWKHEGICAYFILTNRAQHHNIPWEQSLRKI
jgi:hypothetical protein